MRKALVAEKTVLIVTVLGWRPAPVSLRTSRIFVPTFLFVMSPDWRGRLEVTEVELDHEHTSLN